MFIKEIRNYSRKKNDQTIKIKKMYIIKLDLKIVNFKT